MAITKNSGRQHVITAMVVIGFADLTSGADVAALDLPAGAIVQSGDVSVVTPFNSGTSDVIDVGDAGSQNRYLNDGNIHAAGRAALVPTGFKTTSETPVTVRWVGAGAAPTAGSVRLTVNYVVEGRSDFSQG